MGKPNLRAVNEDRAVLCGWIKPCASAFVRASEYDVAPLREELIALGVKVGTWDLFQSEFQDCEVSETALEKLDPLWGKYIWGLS